MFDSIMHWILPLITLVVALILQKIIASKSGHKTKFIIPILYFIVLLAFFCTKLTTLAPLIIFVVLGEFFIVVLGYKTDREHDEIK